MATIPSSTYETPSTCGRSDLRDQLEVQIEQEAGKRRAATDIARRYGRCPRDSLKVLDPEWPIREADIDRLLEHVRFAPESGHEIDAQACPLSADIVAKVQNCPVIIFPP
jgi:hypothetical protein